MFLSEWCEFPSAPCRKKNLMTARVSMSLKSRASLARFRACFLPGRAKDLSAPRYRATFLSNSTFLLCLHVLLLSELSELKSAESWVLWTGVLACRTDRQCLCDPPYNVKRRKSHSALGKASKWTLYPRFCCSYQVSCVWYIHICRQQGKWIGRILLVYFMISKFM